MSLQACADIVAKGDPDRFRAAMATPVAARRVLFPLYAFNVEVARAPWVASEPMIGEMRLQWWRDALEEIADGKAVRKHEVTTPLADVLDAEGANLLDAGVAARRWDLYRDPLEDEDHLKTYLLNTGGALMWVAARALGAKDTARDIVQRYGTASAFVRFLAAVPELEARGRIPLLDGRPEGIRTLAAQISGSCPSPGDLRQAAPGLARAATREGWQTRTLLKMVLTDPSRVAEGRLAQSPFRKSLSLFKASLF